jgi:cytidylate kinase
MAVVTVSRQYGAGGSEVGRRIAAQLGWTVIDNEFVGAVAAQAGLPAEAVAAQEERVPSLMARLARALAISSPEVLVANTAGALEADEARLVEVTERVIREAAAHGRVVLVGRGAQALLAGAKEQDALHVYVTAPREDRIRVVTERHGLSLAEAAHAVDRTDADRDRYVQRHYGRRREDAANYHLVVNTALLGYDGAADMVVTAARRRGWG